MRSKSYAEMWEDFCCSACILFTEYGDQDFNDENLGWCELEPSTNPFEELDGRFPKESQACRRCWKGFDVTVRQLGIIGLVSSERNKATVNGNEITQLSFIATDIEEPPLPPRNGRKHAVDKAHVHVQINSRLHALFMEEVAKRGGNSSRTLDIILWNFFGKPELF